MSFCQPGETAWRSRQRRLPVTMSSGGRSFLTQLCPWKNSEATWNVPGLPVHAVTLSGVLLRILQMPGESVPLSSPRSLLFHLRQCLEKGLTSFVPCEWIFRKDLQLMLPEVGPLDVLAELLGVPRIFRLLLGPPAQCASGRTFEEFTSVHLCQVWSLKCAYHRGEVVKRWGQSSKETDFQKMVAYKRGRDSNLGFAQRRISGFLHLKR